MNRVSKNKRMSEDVLRNTIELQHEQGMLPEKVTILSSEKCGKDMVNVKVSFVLAGEECIMTYPVVLVNNEWIVNVGDGVEPGVVVMEIAGIQVPDYSTTGLTGNDELLGYFKYGCALLLSLLYVRCC
nr:hypothetical protein [Desulforamulus aquiferis]